MSVQGIATPSAPPLPILSPDASDPDAQKSKSQSSGQGSGITITRIDQRDYPDGYVVTTTTYANQDRAIKTAPRSESVPSTASRPSPLDPGNGGQLSALLAAQESTRGAAPIGINPYAR